MIFAVEIDKLQTGLYRAAVTCGGAEVTEPSIHKNIQEAIREEALAVPDGMAHFMEVRYGGMSSGTYPLSKVPENAAEIADRLVALSAELHRHMGM